MKRIGTHNGRFHADEALACALLRQTAAFRGAQVIRTRDPQILSQMDAVVDVGGVYDHATHRYDHHQPTFHDTLSEQYPTRLSSAGLVYKHFGREIIANKKTVSPADLELIFVKQYERFVQAFDAHDNGIPQYPASVGRPAHPDSWDIFAQVASLNPNWNQPMGDEAIDERFQQAMQLVETNFNISLDYLLDAWLPARQIVGEAIQNAGKERFLVLKESCPWKDHLFGLESEKGHFLFVIYPESANQTWRIQAVPLHPDAFELRHSLPEPWLGMRDEELDTLIPDGPKGAVFVHRNGFIGGHKTLEGILHMVRLSIPPSQ